MTAWLLYWGARLSTNPYGPGPLRQAEEQGDKTVLMRARSALVSLLPGWMLRQKTVHQAAPAELLPGFWGNKVGQDTSVRGVWHVAKSGEEGLILPSISTTTSFLLLLLCSQGYGPKNTFDTSCMYLWVTRSAKQYFILLCLMDGNVCFCSVPQRMKSTHFSVPMTLVLISKY